MKKLFLFGLGFLIASCASNIDRQKKEAQQVMDDFVERADQFNAQFKTDAPPQKQRRELLQFTYGPKSFQNTNFLEYLVLSNASLPKDLIGKLRDSENNYLHAEQESSANLEDEIQQFTDIAKVYEKLAKRKTLNTAGTSLKGVMQSLLKDTKLKVVAEDQEVHGKYSGSAYEIIKSIADESDLKLFFSKDFKTFYVKKEIPPEGIYNPVIHAIANNPTGVLRDLKLISDVVRQVESTDVPIDEALQIDEVVKTDYGRSIVKRLIFVQRTKQNVKDQKELASAYRSKLIQKAEEQSFNHTPTIAIFEKEVNNGEEEVIEKFSIYHDTPGEMLKKLQAFTVLNECQTANAAAPPASSTNTSAPDNAVASNTTTAKNPSAEISSNSALTPNLEQQSIDAVIGNTSQNLLAEASELQADAKLGCVEFVAEDYGIVASGSILDVKLIDKFLLDQDQPVKQAMIETFILEVNSDWKNELESRLSTTGDLAAAGGNKGLYTFTSGLLDFASATSEGGITASTRFGTRNQITALINMIETNSLGRKISNPVILVRDGEQGIVDKTRTFRIQAATSVANASTTTTTQNQIDEYEAPLKLTVTPKINKHNDVIDLDFEFVEETYDSNSPTAASTSNNITTKLKIEPGEVVMMAGLFQQTKNTTTQGLPGISQFGFSDILAPLVLLLGGGEVKKTDTGSELLVFINPTVITKENINRTIKRTRY